MATVVTWLGADLVTGQIIEELPDLVPDGPVSVMLSAYTSAAFTLPIPLSGNGAPPRNWLSATEPGRAMIVAVLSGRPVWAGIVLARAGGTGAAVRLACATLEAYLDRRYIGDHDFVFEDSGSVIAAELIDDANLVEGIGFVVDAESTGVELERTYLATDDRTVYSGLRELAASDGPEWTVRLDWTDATETAVDKILRVRSRIGFGSSTPDAVFTTGSASAVVSSAGISDARYEFSEDYSSGRGANHIVAVSTGEGTFRPESFPARDEARIAAGMARFERRFNAGSGLDEFSLDAHALAAVAIMGGGARVLTITARAGVYPVLGGDWWIGDDIGYDLIGHRHPGGLQGVGRAVGWELDPVAGTVSPQLFVPEVEG